MHTDVCVHWVSCKFLRHHKVRNPPFARDISHLQLTTKSDFCCKLYRVHLTLVLWGFANNDLCSEHGWNRSGFWNCAWPRDWHQQPKNKFDTNSQRTSLSIILDVRNTISQFLYDFIALVFLLYECFTSMDQLEYITVGTNKKLMFRLRSVVVLWCDCSSKT